jgi:hypothetical protein
MPYLRANLSQCDIPLEAKRALPLLLNNGIRLYMDMSVRRTANLPGSRLKRSGPLRRQRLYADLPKVAFDHARLSVLNPNTPNLIITPPVILEKLELGDEAQHREIDEFVEQEVNRPLLYVTLGGTAFGSQTITRRLCEAAIDRGFAVICATGKNAALKDAFATRAHILTLDFAPGLYATYVADAVISHGSQGTIEHARLTHTPLVGIPYNMDQVIGLASSDAPYIKPYKRLHSGTLVRIQDTEYMSGRARRINATRIIDQILELMAAHDKQKPPLDSVRSHIRADVQTAVANIQALFPQAKRYQKPYIKPPAAVQSKESEHFSPVHTVAKLAAPIISRKRI